MNYAVAIISGLLLGIVIGAAKHHFIWKPYGRGKSDNIYGRMAISMVIDVLVLLSAFLINRLFAYPLLYGVIPLAISLGITGQILSYLESKKADSSACK